MIFSWWMRTRLALIGIFTLGLIAYGFIINEAIRANERCYQEGPTPWRDRDNLRKIYEQLLADAKKYKVRNRDHWDSGEPFIVDPTTVTVRYILISTDLINAIWKSEPPAR